jgi:glycosyltransferase involved in cell wall biosynthesis
VNDLLSMAMPDLPKISVVVPNFNYAHCLSERLCSIFDQTHATAEIIVLDDASTDDSVKVIETIAEQRDRDLTLIINEQNSGSVFRQWARAAEMAQGEFIWIAEADDLAEAPFLASLIETMRDEPSIAFGFCDSKSIDAKGAPVYPSYKPYFASIEPHALTKDEIFNGDEFVRRFLSVKNVILNVSSVLWRRDALREALQTCKDELNALRMAGDWRVYLECLSKPGVRVAYLSSTLNIHRRHAESVTHSLAAQKHVDEIEAMHRKAKSVFALPAVALEAQRAYAAEVRGQLLGSPHGANQRR